jgi:hypothetical protein
MPIGYVVSVAVAALGTVFALAPPRRPRLLARIGFRVGLVVNELPFLLLVLVLAATALAVGDGEVRSAGGWVVAGAAAVTALGLLVVVRRALRTRPAVQRALGEALGDGWRSAIDPELAAGLGRRPSLARIALWPFPWFPRPRAVQRVANLRYGDARRGNLLDVYVHRTRPPGAPTLVYFHGGRLRQRAQGARGTPADSPARAPGMGVRQRQLPAAPPSGVH